MTRKCFFVPGIGRDAQVIDLPSPVSHHLESVLRARAGDAIEIRDGEGNAWSAEILAVKKGCVRVELLGMADRSAIESPLEITLAMGLARSDTMDLVVRQATEMGVRRLVMFRAARSQYGISGKQAEKKRERWAKIAAEAICQCGRTRTPRVETFEDLQSFLTSFEDVSVRGAETLRIFALERESGEGLGRLRDTLFHCPEIVAAIGPEGGWKDPEISLLENSGFRPVRLGPRIMRLETAAVALLSSIQLLWGDLG